VADAPRQAKRTDACSTEEQQALVAAAQRLVVLISNGNLQGVQALNRELTKHLSAGCQAALADAQRRTDPVAAGCSAQEQQAIASAVQKGTEFVLSDNLEGYLEVLTELNKSLTPRCQAAVAASQRASPHRPPVPRSRPGPPDGTIQDHGGGAYSIPGEVYCGPTGCIPLK